MIELLEFKYSETGTACSSFSGPTEWTEAAAEIIKDSEELSGFICYIDNTVAIDALRITGLDGAKLWQVKTVYGNEEYTYTLREEVTADIEAFLNGIYRKEENQDK